MHCGGNSTSVGGGTCAIAARNAHFIHTIAIACNAVIELARVVRIAAVVPRNVGTELDM